MFLHILIYLILSAAVYAGNVFIDTYIAFIIDAVFIVTSVVSLITVIVLRCGINAVFTQDNAVAYRGEKCTIGIEITNNSPLVLTSCKVKLTVTGINKGKKRSKSVKHRITAMCPPRQSVVRQFEIKCPHCEILGVSMAGVYVYDFLRIFRVRKKLKQNLTVVVLPKIPESHMLDKVSASVGEGEDALYSTVKAGNDPTEIFAIREYVGGDRIRNIHWKLSSKKSELMVKEYGLALTDNDTVIIDIFKTDLPKRKNRRVMDEMYDMLYSLVNALTARGFGFNACYMKDGFNSTRIETDNDINGMFAQIYTIRPYDNENSCAVNYYAHNTNDRRRIFYVSPVYSAEAVKNMALLSENSIVYYMTPRDKDAERIPVKFVMQREGVYESDR